MHLSSLYHSSQSRKSQQTERILTEKQTRTQLKFQQSVHLSLQTLALSKMYLRQKVSASCSISRIASPYPQITHSLQTDTNSYRLGEDNFLEEWNIVLPLQGNEKAIFQRRQNGNIWRPGHSQLTNLPKEWGGNEKTGGHWAWQPLSACLLPKALSILSTGWHSWKAKHLLQKCLSPREKSFQWTRESIAYTCHSDVLTAFSLKMYMSYYLWIKINMSVFKFVVCYIIVTILWHRTVHI